MALPWKLSSKNAIFGLVLACLIFPVMSAELGVQGFIEVVILGCGLFYADIFSDMWSLWRFWKRRQFWFFGVNVTGILMNVCASAFLMGIGEGCKGLVMGLLQLHMLRETILILIAWEKPEPDETFLASPHDKASLLVVFKAFELVESTFSLCVQGYDLVWDTALSLQDETQLRISVAISVLALANGLTTMDKRQTRQQDNIAIESIFSVDFALICSFRVMEITIAAGSLFLFQLLSRPYGGFIAAGVSYTLCVLYLVRGAAFRWNHFNEVFFIVGGCVLLAIPETMYSVSPAGTEVFGMFKHTPPFKLYLVCRCVWVAMLMVSSYLLKGSFQAIWDTWQSYTASATYVAYAVGFSLIGYPLMGVIIVWRYPNAHMGYQRVDKRTGP